MTNRELNNAERGTAIGAFIGGCLSAGSWPFGPLIGSVVTAGGTTLGGTVGYLCGRGVDWMQDVCGPALTNISGNLEKASESGKKAVSNVEAASQAFQEFMKTAARCPCFVMSSGLSLMGVSFLGGLKYFGVQCHNTCHDQTTTFVYWGGLTMFTVGTAGMIFAAVIQPCKRS